MADDKALRATELPLFFPAITAGGTELNFCGPRGAFAFCFLSFSKLPLSDSELLSIMSLRWLATCWPRFNRMALGYGSSICILSLDLMLLCPPLAKNMAAFASSLAWGICPGGACLGAILPELRLLRDSLDPFGLLMISFSCFFFSSMDAIAWSSGAGCFFLTCSRELFLFFSTR